MAESTDEDNGTDDDLDDGIEIKEQKEDIDIMNKSLAATSKSPSMNSVVSG